jgi:hypothetical protein
MAFLEKLRQYFPIHVAHRLPGPTDQASREPEAG